MSKMSKEIANKKRYKIMCDTKNTFLDIELDLVLDDDTIGTTVNVLGGTFKITQNGKILVLVEPDWCLTLMDVTPVPEVKKPKLVINETLEIFFKTKEIQVKTSCTYEELFYVLQDEWKLAGVLMTESLPFDYSERLKLFTFTNDWRFAEGSLPFMKNGSFSRKNSMGRNI
jgi:hypothetical protein